MVVRVCVDRDGSRGRGTVFLAGLRRVGGGGHGGARRSEVSEAAKGEGTPWERYAERVVMYLTETEGGGFVKMTGEGAGRLGGDLNILARSAEKHALSVA